MLDDTLEINEEKDISRVLFLRKDHFIVQKISIFNKDIGYFVI
jgi:hypothetical protein